VKQILKETLVGLTILATLAGVVAGGVFLLGEFEMINLIIGSIATVAVVILANIIGQCVTK
jgi:hypothetical protein